MEEPHDVADRLFFFWACAVGSERQSGQTEQSYLRSGTDLLFSKTHVHSGLHQSPETLAEKPQSPCMAAAGFVFGSAMISRDFPCLSDVTWCRSNGAWHWTSQDWNVYLWQEHWEKHACCLGSCSHPHTRRLTQIHTLALHLWWFKPCPLVGVRRGYLRQMSSEKQGCLKSRPQKECTPAWIPHSPKALWG